MNEILVTVLGCGTSSGVPSPGHGWGKCNPKNKKNYRLRSSIIIQLNGKSLLVDTSPDLRHQLIQNNITSFDGVFFTHSHSDHIHGLNDVRWINQAIKQSIKCWSTAEVYATLKQQLGYAFTDTFSKKNDFFKPELVWYDCRDGFDFAGEKIVVFDQFHGRGFSQGLRVSDFSYSTDVVALDDKALSILKGTKVWIVDALNWHPHPSHAHVGQVIEWADNLEIPEVYLTHMGLNMDYDDLMLKLPSHIKPAFDGLKITIALK